MPKVTIELPKLHSGRNNSGGQIAVARNPARFKVIVCGRRWGKTTLGVHQSLDTGLRGGRVWWVAPTYKVAFVGWRMLKRLANRIPGAEIREGDRWVALPGGGEVWIKSADDPDSLRGEGLDGVVLDEVAQIKQAAWTEALSPALTDKKGWAIFIGTPKGKNWLYRLWQIAEKQPDWARWQKPTIDNPYIDVKEIERARRESTSINIFRQEYEADFGASQLQVYPDFDPVFHKWKWKIPQFKAFVGGLDFGGTSVGSHKSAGIFGGVTEADFLVELYEFEQSGSRVAEHQLNWMAECEARAKVLQRSLNHRPANNYHWYADRSQSGFIGVVAASGYSITPSLGGRNSVNSGVALVQGRLQVRGDGFSRIYYAPELTAFPAAMERYRYPEFTEEEVLEKPLQPNPLKVQDDMADGIRYQVEGLDAMVVGDPQELYKNLLPAVI
ncbi:hypothetical protein LCGC14_0740500 [marine sediment metagenome]|uniref:Uncharacterized protein n=1 Tax=marine sediment metagenome TaxID=412755 RepID=A0A0F9SRR7_9ZZZZ